MGVGFPIKFQVKQHLPPDFVAKKGNCKKCQLAYAAHSYTVCLFCGAPVEHHGKDQDSTWQGCLEGRQRVALARRQANIELSVADDLALQELSK